MKWLFNKLLNKESQNHSSEDKSPSVLRAILLTVGLIISLAGVGWLISLNASKVRKIGTPNSLDRSLEEINNIAANISVQILDEGFLGSGFLVQQKDNQYVVITNQHVLRAGEAPYKIQTPDGKIHSAEVITDSIQSKYEYDLAVLQFTTDNNYTVAKIGSSLYLEVGEPIYAVGFPYTEVESQTSANSVESDSNPNSIKGLTLKTGKIAIILRQALVEGYQIGYTNDVKKGMSGGPLLNSRGEVVGVNGKHAYPLWESPELYQDGSQPCPALEKLITRSSLAIPIEKSIELNPQLKTLKPISNIEASRRSNLLLEDPRTVAKMQREAQLAAESCQQYGDTSDDDLSEKEGVAEQEE